MSADAERGRFHINRVASADLGAILAAQSHRPEVVMAIGTLKRFDCWMPLAQVCANTIGPGPHPTYTDAGHPCIKTQNVNSLIVADEPAGWVSLEDAVKMDRFLVRQGDLVMNLTGAGSIGRAAVYLGSEQPLTNQHLARLVVMNSHDSCYVAAFLNSWWAQRAIEQGISGATGQLNLINEHVRSLPIVLPSHEVQTYIGDKIRRVETLRTRAQRLRLRNSMILPHFYDFDAPAGGGHGSYERVLPSQIMDTISAHPYMHEYVEAERIVRAWGGERLADISTSIVDGPFGSNLRTFEYLPGGRSGHPLVRVSNVRDACFVHSDMAFISPKKQEELLRSEVLAGDLLITKAGRIGSAAVYPQGISSGNITSHLVRVRLRQGIDPWFVAEFLESPVGLALTRRFSFKATRPELTKREIEQCLVPIVDGDAMSQVGDNARGRSQILEVADRLLQIARFLVEALIERKVTEDDLIAAHNDPAADRALLERLTVDGLDVPDAAPLFPDLDQLFALLAEASEEDET